MSTASYLHISGMGRSGTTLLDKLLGNHPQLSVMSQPFPLLFVHVKQSFLASLGLEPRHPLSHYFPRNHYGLDELASFLATHRVGSAEVKGVFQQMASYSGWLYRPDDLATRLAQIAEGPFVDVLEQLLRTLPSRHGCRYYGSKEIYTEEFLPFLCRAGWRCLLIVRDPRDAVASFNSGRGPEWGGELRPTLFHIRNWRKSVGVQLLLTEHPGFLALRYEDLVSQTRGTLARVARFLNLEDFPEAVAAGELVDQKGEPWQGNSSHVAGTGILPRTVGRYRERLPPDVTRFIEATCGPELKYLGYECDTDTTEAESALTGFTEPFPIVRTDFTADYSSTPEHRQQELTRLRLVQTPQLTIDEQRYFLAPEVHRKLHSATHGNHPPTD